MSFGGLFTIVKTLTLYGTLAPGAWGPLTRTTSSEGMTAWASPELRLDGLKPHQIGWPYLDHGVIADEGSTVTCETGDKPAILYAFVYGCFPCESTAGDLVGHLFEEGWRLGYCGPTMHCTRTGRNYRMISYAKDIPADSSYTLTFPSDASYVSFVATEDILVCGDFTSQGQGACEAAGTGDEKRCKWNGLTSTCEYAYCHGNIGPVLDLCKEYACALPATDFLPATMPPPAFQ